MIEGFDFDGTLVQSWTATPLPGVRERLAQPGAHSKTFIATNQAGRAFRTNLGGTRSPAVEDVARIADGLMALHQRPHLLLVSCYAASDGGAWWRAEAVPAGEFDHQFRTLPDGLAVLTFVMPNERKLQPGMLIPAQPRLGEGDMVSIGDSECDEAAAAAESARYLDVATWVAVVD